MMPPAGARRSAGAPAALKDGDRPPDTTTMTDVVTIAGTEQVAALDAVLAAGSLRSVFQPIVDLGTGAVTAYEAPGPRARGAPGAAPTSSSPPRAPATAWPPWTLRAACPPSAPRPATGVFDPVGLFVNVEPEVLDTAPLDDLLEVMAGAAGDLRVVLEITERAIATRPADLLSTVERVRSLGWGVALDDVGAEPLSLAFMPLLRPDVVKLDLALTPGATRPARRGDHERGGRLRRGLRGGGAGRGDRDRCPPGDGPGRWGPRWARAGSSSAAPPRCPTAPVPSPP